jgi:hypothetical protein
LPAAELEEMPDAILVKLELPGMEAKDLDIEVTGMTVSISGECKTEKMGTCAQNSTTLKTKEAPDVVLGINLGNCPRVPGGGLEPPTRGFSVLCSTN